MQRAEADADATFIAGRTAPGALDAAPAPELSVRAAEVDGDKLFVAGVAPPGALVRVYANDELVGTVEAENGGHWLIEAARDIPLGKVVIRADAVRAEPVGAEAEAPSLRAEVPFMRYPDGIVLEPALAAASQDGGHSEASGALPAPALVIIRRGDNLWRISRRNYGRGIRYKSIFAANREAIHNPDLIYPGQVFLVPTRDRGWEAASN